MAVRRKPDVKVRRRADLALVVAYHEARLADVLEHVRDGFKAYGAGDLDAFELDHVIRQYKRSARELWVFCSPTRRSPRPSAIPGAQ